MQFRQKFDAIMAKRHSLLCIGLDSDISQIPQSVRSDKTPQFRFNKAIIDATYDLVCAYKPNSAFYEARGTQGMTELVLTCAYLHHNYPEIPIILDAKRADISSTNQGYVQYAFEWLKADAITVHPYLGYEALLPFLQREDKGIFVLCRTSNPGAGEFQDLKISKTPLYQIVATHVADRWNTKGNCGLVVGATYIKELAIVRHLAPGALLLVPGVGDQGGQLEAVVKSAIDSRGKGAIINVSRSVLFASPGEQFAQAARHKAQSLKEVITAAVLK